MDENIQEAIDERIAELRTHMKEEGELAERSLCDPCLDACLVWEQNMKLVRMPGAEALYAVPSEQDWAHDALGEIRCISGTLYADDEPFVEGAAAVSGYFQADDDGRWVRVDDGAAPFAAGSDDVTWVACLEDFPEVVTQLEACMSVSAYRHVAEQAALKGLVGA